MTSILVASITHRDCTCSNVGTTYGCARGLDRAEELRAQNRCLNTDNHVADGEGTHECTACGLYDAI